MPDYEQIRRLGAGQFGEVWLVFDRALAVQRAVKFVPPTRIPASAKIYDEPQTLKRLTHPNIVAVEDAGTLADGSLYIAMEYLPAGSLEDSVSGGVVPIRRARTVAADVCRGLEYIHTNGFIHRDIKPANVLLANDGTAKLSDFGLAAKLDATGTASAYGYLAHLAPEVIRDGTTSKLTDIYAVGVTLYRLINGDSFLPRVADVAALEQLIVAGSFPDRSAYRPFVPRSLRRVVNKAMNADPIRRFRSAGELRRALERVRLECDWETTAVPEGLQWNASVGSMEFQATLLTPATSPSSFELVKGNRGIAKRRVASDCLVDCSPSAALNQAANVLARITEHGR